MAVQIRIDNTTIPFIKSGTSYVRNMTIAQDAARTVDLLQNTVMAYHVVNQNWVPFIVLNGNEGESVPQAIYLGDDIPFADLVDGDIEDAEIMTGGSCTVDESLVVWDQNLQTSASVVPAAAANPIFVITAAACLKLFGIFFEDTEDISELENT